MSRSANIHDSFFKRALIDRQAADLFLREHLPPDVVNLLSPELPELLPGSFVDERLGQHHIDLLFRIQLTTEQDALAYLLMEHKSSPDQAFLKALKYVLRPDLSEYLGVLLAEGAQLPIVDVVQILAYIGRGPVPVSPGALREVLQRFMPDHAEEIMQGFGQQYFEEGIAVGKAEGEAQALRARIFAADLASIETWFDRAIEATEFESVFDRN